MAHVMSKVYIGFGLVSTPVAVFAAVGDESISFRQVHECNGKATPIQQRLHCSTCNSTVNRDELKSGIEVSKGQFAVVDPSELNELKPGKSDLVQIEEFVSLSEVDPVYFNKTYYLAPQTAGTKAYDLLLAALEQTKLAGRATWVYSNKTYNVLIRTYQVGTQRCLAMQTLFTQKEVRALSQLEADQTRSTFSEKELNLAVKAVEELRTTFDSAKLQDEYGQKVAALVEAKKSKFLEGTGQVVNDETLTERLEKSLEKFRNLAKQAA